MSTSRRRGLTFVEIMVGVVFFAMLSYFLYNLVFMTARRSGAADRKLQTVRAAMEVASRLRHDLTWATNVTIGPKGDQVLLEGRDGTKRVWAYDAKSMELRLPDHVGGDPTQFVRYELARFRLVRLQRLGATWIVRYVVSALPPDLPAGGPSKQDLQYSTTVVGEVGLRHNLGVAQNPLCYEQK